MPACVIVCEKTGSWAAAIRREPGNRGLLIRETRSLADCWVEVAVSPESLVAVEATRANLATLVSGLLQLSRQHPHARAVVLAARSMRRCEWIVREASAAHVLFSTRQIGILVRLAHRHLTERQRASSQLDEDLRALIFKRLPWGRRASSSPET